MSKFFDCPSFLFEKHHFNFKVRKEVNVHQMLINNRKLSKLAIRLDGFNKK